jgi:chromosome segregation ATPase
MAKKRTTEQILTRMVDQLRKENAELKTKVTYLEWLDGQYAEGKYLPPMSLEEKLKSADERCSYYAKELDELTANYTKVRFENAQYKHEIIVLQERVAELEQNQCTPELHEWIAGLERSVSELTQDKIELKDQNKELETKVAKLKDQNKELKKFQCTPELREHVKELEYLNDLYKGYMKNKDEELIKLKREILGYKFQKYGQTFAGNNTQQSFCPEDLDDRLVGLIKIAHPDRWNNHDLATEITKHLNDWRKDLKKVA